MVEVPRWGTVIVSELLMIHSFSSCREGSGARELEVDVGLVTAAAGSVSSWRPRRPQPLLSERRRRPLGHHLRVLREAGLVTGTRKGTNTWHRPRPEALAALVKVLAPACC